MSALTTLEINGEAVPIKCLQIDPVNDEYRFYLMERQAEKSRQSVAPVGYDPVLNSDVEDLGGCLGMSYDPTEPDDIEFYSDDDESIADSEDDLHDSENYCDYTRCSKDFHNRIVLNHARGLLSYTLQYRNDLKGLVNKQKSLL
ncbi:uncharacterized protein LOC129237252 isoform X2 [Anastrepha obliqua]|uniref:uncharacterized protein LOC129237252 isoform X2 n=1 Tax=Anastrepha obliqua TaxID=95512 RepID=UPI00240902CB|nr:uncharacterized protein LOC129237252 isoform X2 [Anastrepha obliqua]